jgi:hypothetical protein
MSGPIGFHAHGRLVDRHGGCQGDERLNAATAGRAGGRALRGASQPERGMLARPAQTA